VFSVGISQQKINGTFATGFQTTKFRMLHEQQLIGSVNQWYGNIACHRGEVILSAHIPVVRIITFCNRLGNQGKTFEKRKLLDLFYTFH